MFKQLEVDWGNKSKFWDKSEEERYEYFRNASIEFLKVIKKMEEGSDLKDFSSEAMTQLSNVLFFLVFLMTTDEEQGLEIEKVWLGRMKKDLEGVSSDIFINYNQEGVA
jgi:hypothetical protein